MTENPAFLWETEAMRETTQRRAERDRSPRADWLTLRDAHVATSIPVETLRKWARRDAVDSYLDESTNLRMVSLASVRRRAASLGRDVRRVSPSPPPPRAEERVASAPEAVERYEIGPAAMQPEEPPAAEQQDGTMIVPIAAWDKMLMQLGNLHEAGQQLAEARERAAKAETEARFLRERLAEIRAELGSPAPQHREAPTDPTDREHPASPPDEHDAVATTAGSQRLWRYVYEGWRHRRRT